MNSSRYFNKGVVSNRFSSELDTLFKKRNNRIFIDTSSMIHPASYKFWSQALPLIGYHANKVFIPKRCIEEIKRFSRNKKDLNLAHHSTIVLKHLDILITAGAVDVRSERYGTFNDNIFISLFTKFRRCNNMVLITQNSDLAKDIFNLNKTKAVKEFPVMVKKIDENGNLADFPFAKNYDMSEAFNICSYVTSVSDSPLDVKHIPQRGSTVHIKNGFVNTSLKLTEVAALTDEAKVYRTDSQDFAKIYSQQKLTNQKYEKLNRMLQKKPVYPGICFPTNLIYNSDGQFVGCFMPEAKGKNLQETLFVKRSLLNQFPKWKKVDTVELCLTILDKIKFMHERNILVGDINPANIMVVSSTEVYFIETDSYQIESFPSHAGSINFTAPEIQGSCFSSFLRSKGNENFAVATLLFMIMHLGKPPYSEIGEESSVQNIVNMNFPYSLGQDSNKQEPENQWGFMWSHLPFEIKDAFYNSFIKDGLYSYESSRLSVDNWIDKFKKYQFLLNNGTLREQDPLSEELFPNRCKQMLQCKICEKTIDADSPNQSLCISCYMQQKTIYSSNLCTECGKEFTISNSEAADFLSKGMKLPEKCPECRKKGNSQPFFEINQDSDSSEKTSFSKKIKNFFSW